MTTKHSGKPGHGGPKTGSRNQAGFPKGKPHIQGKPAPTMTMPRAAQHHNTTQGRRQVGGGK